MFDENKLIPVLFVSRHNYHKIPGGGIEKSEDKTQALTREVLEETGCEVEISGEIGEVNEYRSRWNLFQTSYCYIGKIIKKGEASFTKDERKNGFQLLWLSLDEAIEKFKNDKPNDYEGKFINERDLAFLEEAKSLTS